MKIKKVWIENFRSINALDIDWKDVLALVGPNNSGKSNILTALEWILGKILPTAHQTIPEDFYNRNTLRPIKIKIRFDNLTEEERKHFRARARGLMRKEGGKPIFMKNREGKPMGNYSQEYINICLELPYEEAGKFYFLGDDLNPIKYGGNGDERSVKREDRAFFPKFIFIPGIRDANKYFSNSTRYDWGKILDSVRDQINQSREVKQSLIHLTESISQNKNITDLEHQIESYFLEFLTEEYKNTNLTILPVDPGDLLRTVKLIVDDGFKSILEYKGDGVKSLAVIILFLLAAKGDKNLVIGLEEPELFIHPSALFVLNQAMQKQEKFGSQIIYSSHSPFLINVTRPKSIVRVYKESNETKVAQLLTGSHWLTGQGEQEIERDIDAQRNLLFFAKAVILIEGPTEYLSLPTFASKMGVDLAKKGIVLVEVNGKPNLKRYSNYLTDFKISHIIVYDKDTEYESLNESIESLDVIKFPMNLNFEDMLITDLSAEETNTLLEQAYSETFNKYKAHWKVKDLKLIDQLHNFLNKSKPFAARHIAERIQNKEQIPETIQNIVNAAIEIVGDKTKQIE